MIFFVLLSFRERCGCLRYEEMVNLAGAKFSIPVYENTVNKKIPFLLLIVRSFIRSFTIHSFIHSVRQHVSVYLHVYMFVLEWYGDILISVYLHVTNQRLSRFSVSGPRAYDEKHEKPEHDKPQNDPCTQQSLRSAWPIRPVWWKPALCALG